MKTTNKKHVDLKIILKYPFQSGNYHNKLKTRLLILCVVLISPLSCKWLKKWWSNQWNVFNNNKSYQENQIRKVHSMAMVEIPICNRIIDGKKIYKTIKWKVSVSIAKNRSNHGRNNKERKRMFDHIEQITPVESYYLCKRVYFLFVSWIWAPNDSNKSEEKKTTLKSILMHNNFVQLMFFFVFRLSVVFIQSLD